jgi:potassium-transporting ATPase potassium-binding subunit
VSAFGILQSFAFVVLLVALTRPLGAYMARVFSGERTPLDPALRPLERGIYSLIGVNPRYEMRWTRYTINMLLFNLCGIVIVYGILRFQHLHPWNPTNAPDMSPDLAFNTAVSFVSNTNWQAYLPERDVSYFSQMAAFTWQNFVSAGTGIAVALALIRGLTRHSGEEVGNFWVDLTRACLWVLLPIAILMAVFFMSSGVIQTLGGPVVANTIEGVKQTIARGPVASQEAIKILGVNGGGFFNANSAHPFENPTPLTNFVQVLAIFAIPAGLTYTFGRYAGNQRQGWALFAAMTVLFAIGLAVITGSEQSGNPNIAEAGVSQSATSAQSGGSMEGKEVRFGAAGSALFTNVTTDASCGAVNNSHDSLTPLGGGMAMLNIAMGEVVFGGVGTGLMGMLIFALLAVFIAGLMVGRTPEYLGKKIESKEMKMIMLAVLVLEASILGFSALASTADAGLEGRLNLGPHGLSEILYAATSATGNNGSAFAGLSANSLFYNLTLGLAMLIGRFLWIIPVMAIAGTMARKRIVPQSGGTFPTTGGLFVGLLVGAVLIVGALTFFPAYALGPIVEHFLMHANTLF